MDMTLVDEPRLAPHVCADGTQSSPMVDTLLRPIHGNRLYLSRKMVVEAGRLFGLVEPDDHAAVVARLDEAAQTIVDLEGELAELEDVRRALTSVSARFGALEADDEPVRRAPRRKAA